MKEHQTSRTLLKSPPELWAECSDAQSLARHLGESVGEIRITELEPEHTVAWEGDRASGTVKLEPSGWGTRVTLTCSEPDDEREPELEHEANDERPPEPGQETHDEREREPDPPPGPSTPEATSPSTSEHPPPAPAHGRLLQRVMRFFAPPREATNTGAADPDQSAASESPPPEAPSATQPQLEPRPPEPPAQPEPPPPESAQATEGVDVADLSAALDSLGQAHHRPFSRA
jgi:hypothetical protein